MGTLSHEQFESYWNFWCGLFVLSFFFGAMLLLSAFLVACSPDYDSSGAIVGGIITFIVGWFVLISAGYWLCKLVYNEKTFFDYCRRGPLWK